jgi:hypothetical protein
MSTSDIIVPLEWEEKLHVSTGVKGFRGYINGNGRLHRRCEPEEGRVDEEAFIMTAEIAEMYKIKVPVVFVDGPVVIASGKRYCPVSLLIQGVSSISIGRSLLLRYDVSFDAFHSVVGLEDRVLKLPKDLPAPFPPALMYLESFVCTVWHRSVNCHGPRSGRPSSVQLQRVRPASVDLGCTGISDDIANLPRLAYSAFQIGGSSQGGLLVRAERDSDGEFELHATRTRRGFNISFVKRVKAADSTKID